MQTLERSSVSDKRQSGAQKSPGLFKGTAFFVALLVFIGINFAFDSASHGKRNIAEVKRQSKEEQAKKIAPRHSWGWWLSKLYQDEAKAPDVVVFGSSLLGSAHVSVDASYLIQLLDVLTHRHLRFLEKQISDRAGHSVSVFSLGSPGEMISDYYAISKTLIFDPIQNKSSVLKKPKLVIATIAPRDFVDNTLPYPAATDHYQFFSNYSELSQMDREAYPDLFARIGSEIERLPIKRLSRKTVTPYAELARADAAETGKLSIKPGDCLVPAGAVPKQADNTKEYEERFKNPFSANYNAEMHFFDVWLAEMKKNNIPVMVVCMPTTAANRNLLPARFWQDFRARVSAACKENNADWYDLSDCIIFQQSDYLDTVHLNAYGALRLFPVIAERMLIFPPAAKALSSAEANNQSR